MWLNFIMITVEVYMIYTKNKNLILVPVLPLVSCLPWGEPLSESLIHISQMAGLNDPWVPRSNHLWFSIILDSLDDEYFFIFTNLNVLKCCTVGHDLINKSAVCKRFCILRQPRLSFLSYINIPSKIPIVYHISLGASFCCEVRRYLMMEYHSWSPSRNQMRRIF